MRFALLCALLVAGVARAQPPLSLPPPPGPHAVGTATYAVEDPSRPEVATDDPYDLRALALQVWYPAEPGVGEPAPYVPDAEAWEVIYSDAFTNLLGRTLTHSRIGAPVAQGRRYPVLLVSGGFGMSRHFYTTLAEGLASHGYVVVAIDRPYLNTIQTADGAVRSPRDGFWDAFPATRGIDDVAEAARRLRFTEGYLAADQAAALKFLEGLNEVRSGDPLAGRLDIDRLVNVAHSAGTAPARALMLDPAAPYRGYVFFDSKVHYVAGAPDVVLPVEGRVQAPILFVGLEYAPAPPDTFAGQLDAPLVAARFEGTTHNSVADLAYLEALSEGDEDRAADVRGHLTALLDLTHRFVRWVLEGPDGGPSTVHVDGAEVTVLQPSEP